MIDLISKYFGILKKLEIPCLIFSTYEAVEILENCISLGDVKLQQDALEKLSNIIINDQDMGEFYSKTLIDLAMELRNELTKEMIIKTFGEKLGAYYSSKIIKKTIKLNDKKLFNLVWKTLNANLDSCNSNKLMEKLIDTKNTHLLQIITDRITSIIKDDSVMGDYYLRKLFEKAIKSKESEIKELVASILVDKLNIIHIGKAIKCAIEVDSKILLEKIVSNYGKILNVYDAKLIIIYAIEKNEYRIFDVLWINFSNKFEHTDCYHIIKSSIESENIQFFHSVWEQLQDQRIYRQKKFLIKSALESRDEYKIDVVVKKYITLYYNESEIKYLIKILSQSPKYLISKEIKMLFSKLILRLKTVDFENLEYFIQEELLNEKYEDGFPFSYHLFQKEVGIPVRKVLDSIDINRFLPKEVSIFSESNSYKYYINKEANKFIMFVRGEDHNGAFNDDTIHQYLKRGFNIISIDHRNEKDICLSLKNYLFDYYGYIQKQSIDLGHSDLLILSMHGGLGPKTGKHTVTRDDQSIRTFKYLKDLTDKIKDKPVKVLLTSCYGQHALLDSIEILPSGSEMLTISEYREENNELIKINNNNIINKKFASHIVERIDLDISDLLNLENITYLYVKGYSSNMPSPTYAKKYHDGKIKSFSCIEKFKDLIDGKIKLSYIRNIQENFIVNYCGSHDNECIEKSSFKVKETLDSITYMQMLNLGYKYHLEEMTEKLLDRDSLDFGVNLALGCQIGFNEINGYMKC